MTNKPKHQAQWKRLADMLVPKWEPASIVLDDKMYVHGGYENGIVSGKNLHVFDPEGATHGSWKKLQDLPSSISHVNLCLLYTSPSPRDKRQSRMPSSA